MAGNRAYDVFAIGVLVAFTVLVTSSLAISSALSASPSRAQG
ncbi:hypothetical protein OG552_16150 [Streptomyces sp. NBC_01476]|nr:hypothetical protein [Streptomyces sp. NBC_01476]